MAVGSEDMYTHQQHTSQHSTRYTLYCYNMITFPTGEVMGLASTANLADLNTSNMVANMHEVFILSDRQRRTDRHMTQMKTLLTSFVIFVLISSDQRHDPEGQGVDNAEQRNLASWIARVLLGLSMKRNGRRSLV